MRGKATDEFMKIAYHIGTYGTDEDLLLRILLANRAALSARGVLVPAPSRYRRVIIESLRNLGGVPPSPAMQAALLDVIMDEDHADRLILSGEQFLGPPTRALGPIGLFPYARRSAAELVNLFPDHDCEFHLALRHPAAFLTALLPRLSDPRYERMMDGLHPHRLRWSEAVRRFLDGADGRRLVVWCHEDAPLILPEVARRLADVGTDLAIHGTGQLLTRLLRPEGIALLEAAMRDDPPATVGARRELVAQALTRFARPEEVERAVMFPGWDDIMMEDLDDIYDDDVADIAAMPGVEFIAP